VVVIVLVGSRQEDLRPDDLTIKKTIKDKRMDRTITRYKMAKLPAEIVNVVTRENIPEKIAADHSVFGIVKSLTVSPARVQDRAVIGELIQSEWFSYEAVGPRHHLSYDFAAARSNGNSPGVFRS